MTRPTIQFKTGATRWGVALIALASMTGAGIAPTVSAQTVGDSAPAIPSNVQVFGAQQNNVFRPTARVNDEIITATDVEQRVALVRLANRGNIPDDQLAAVRAEVFSQLVDEILKIQEAAGNKITVTQSDVDQEFARIAASQRMTPQQFAQYLTSAGSSAASMQQQIRADLAWQHLLGRNIEPFTNVSEEDARTQIEREMANRGAPEFRVGEIYLRATPETLQAKAETARRIMEALGQGQPFGELARRNSESTTASTGGDLGWVRANQLPQSLAEAVQGMQPGQLAGPIQTPGGVSIVYLIDKRQVLTADPRDAVLSLKQISLNFPTGTTMARASELAATFAQQTRAIAGCGQADAVAASLGAEIISRDQIAMRDLPPPLQATLAQLQIGQVTQPFGSPEEGVSVLVLCGRETPEQAPLPSVEQVADNMRQQRVNRRAQRYLRDLRRDAVIDYGQAN
jgi:peptidyl-prolyl cis-trans isomerase SurA